MSLFFEEIANRRKTAIVTILERYNIKIDRLIKGCPLYLYYLDSANLRIQVSGSI